MKPQNLIALTAFCIWTIAFFIGVFFGYKAAGAQRQSHNPDIYYCVFSASGTEGGLPVKTFMCFNPSLDEHCSVSEFQPSGDIRTTCAYVQWPKDRPKR
jgi:hypothetical protein